MISLSQMVSLGVGGGLLVVAIVASFSLFESLDAGQLKDYKGNWVPSVVIEGGNGAQTVGSGAQELIDLLTVKTAKELGLDMSIRTPIASGDTK
jgi:hypothetical protein